MPTPNETQPASTRVPKVTDIVEYFSAGTPNKSPSVGIVVKVSQGGVIGLHVLGDNGQQYFRECVRHWSDPVLKDNQDLRRLEGCYRFPDEPQPEPHRASPSPAKKPAKAAERPELANV